MDLLASRHLHLTQDRFQACIIPSKRSHHGVSRAAPRHHDIWKYSQSTGEVHAKVLQNLTISIAVQSCRGCPALPILLQITLQLAACLSGSCHGSHGVSSCFRSRRSWDGSHHRSCSCPWPTVLHRPLCDRAGPLTSRPSEPHTGAAAGRHACR